MSTWIGVSSTATTVSPTWSTPSAGEPLATCRTSAPDPLACTVYPRCSSATTVATVFESAISRRLACWFWAGDWCGGMMSLALAMVTDESKCANSHSSTDVSCRVTATRDVLDRTGLRIGRRALDRDQVLRAVGVCPATTGSRAGGSSARTRSRPPRPAARSSPRRSATGCCGDGGAAPPASAPRSGRAHRGSRARRP